MPQQIASLPFFPPFEFSLRFELNATTHFTIFRDLESARDCIYPYLFCNLRNDAYSLAVIPDG